MLNHTEGAESEYSMRLSGGYGENIGLAKSISVMPGDTVRMEVFGKYIDISEAKRNPAIMAVLMAVTAANPMAMGVDGALATAASQTAAVKASLAGLMGVKEESNEAPPAYLNYLFFDSDMNYKYGGFVQMSNAAREDGTNNPHEKLSNEVVAEEPGYFYIYLSNDSNVGSEAFFDDFSIQVSESFIVQQTDYYPYGLIAKNWTRVGDKATQDLFQGKTYDEITKMYDFHARKYDAALGRWFGTDPQNQFASPYVAMGNNPVSLVDPNGEFVIPLMIVGAFMNTIFQNATGNVNNFGDFIKSMAVGALAGGAGFGAGQFVAGTVGTIGFGAGAISGFAGGFAGGFVGGAGNAWSGGASFGSGLKSGIQAGLYSGATAGLIGGISAGISAERNGANFFSGKYRPIELKESSVGTFYGSDAGHLATDEYLDSYYMKRFGNEYKSNYGVRTATTQHLPDGFSFNETTGSYIKNKTKESVLGVAVRQKSNLTDIYISRKAFSSDELLFLTTGHELIHAYHHSIGLSTMNFGYFNYEMYSENAAYSWMYRISKDLGLNQFAASSLNKLENVYPHSHKAFSWRRIPGFPNKY
jgi:RHS repeat-associated protein